MLSQSMNRQQASRTYIETDIVLLHSSLLSLLGSSRSPKLAAALYAVHSHCRAATKLRFSWVQVDGERAAQAAVQWLRSCNAIVVLEQGGVYGACCIFFDGTCSCDSLDYKRVFVSKHCAFPCCCSKLCCSSLLHGPESESVTVASLGLTVLFVQVHSPQLHCWTANHPYAFPCLKMSLLLHMGMPLSTCTASCIKCMSVNSAASNSTAISHLSFTEINI